ncbi:MAG TPA: glucosamine-6-phosphate deaminase [Firmicutes bacterium]|jgi:glucosamine-6-phosphate deaminase|nr:glucosamine-6-phosphate deaminase [Bacillota bacterium]
MRVLIEKDYTEMSKKAALMVAGQVLLQPATVLGLATGSTTLGLYQELIGMYRRGEVDFANVTTFNLDEYYSLGPDHPQSYHYFMYENLFNHINVKAERIHLPSGTAADIKAACAAYERKITEAGGIDLQVLGVGVNGHIGFNEPNPSLPVYTDLVDLTEETIQVNSRFFRSVEEVPRQAVTMGIGTILKARRIILLANGRHKAEAIRKTVSGMVTSACPSSFLQTHPDVTIILDQEAAALLG